jgi:hypothetical protein
MNKKCPKCSKEHNKSGKFCSRSCANSKVFSEESREKKRQASLRYWKNNPIDESKKLLLAELSPNSTNNYLIRLFEQTWEETSIWSKRIRVILEQDGKCNRCGITHWQGQRITLEYEHKDGNHDNNNRDNVECLCPNCHSLTNTWRGRNNRIRQDKVEKYLDAI